MDQGTRWVLLMQKNRRRKSHAWAPLKGQRHQKYVPDRQAQRHIDYAF